MRDIPDVVPDDIATTIYSRWGDMKSFSDACGISYTAVYSLLARSGGHRAMDLIEKLAKELGCSEEAVANIFRLPLGEPRKTALQSLAGERALTDISQAVFGYNSKLHDIIKGRSGSKHVPNLLAVLDTLGIDIKRFKAEYKSTESAA